jgi:hypothetical protein
MNAVRVDTTKNNTDWTKANQSHQSHQSHTSLVDDAGLTNRGEEW